MSDASLARCPDSRKSTGAWVIFCNGGAVAATSKKYSFVDLSSTSAELKALSFAAVAVSGMRILLDCIGRPCAAPSLLVNDCRSAIIVAENPGKLRTRMNHLPTSAFKVRECVQQALVDLCWLLGTHRPRRRRRAHEELGRRHVPALPSFPPQLARHPARP